MIRNKSLFFLTSLLMFCLLACKKETTREVSKVLKVPVIEMIGNEVISLPVGATYTDAGARYTGEDGNTVPLQATSNNVNTAQPGLYFVVYAKKSASGIFDTEATRFVAVAHQDSPADYSGTYLRPATGINAMVAKVANGVYRVRNPGGAAGHDAVVVYFVESAPNTFIAPPQPTAAGTMSVTDITFTPTGGSWKIVNPLYGTSLRTFVKQ